MKTLLFGSLIAAVACLEPPLWLNLSWQDGLVIHGGVFAVITFALATWLAEGGDERRRP